MLATKKDNDLNSSQGNSLVPTGGQSLTPSDEVNLYRSFVRDAVHESLLSDAYVAGCVGVSPQYFSKMVNPDTEKEQRTITFDHVAKLPRNVKRRLFLRLAREMGEMNTLDIHIQVDEFNHSMITALAGMLSLGAINPNEEIAS